MDNNEFLKCLGKQYLSCFDKLIKLIKIPLDQMFLICDYPRQNIWRYDYYNDYKGIHPNNSGIGQYIKYLIHKFKNMCI